MDSIIALSFINKEIEPQLSNNDLIQHLKKSNFLIRPTKFEDLKKYVQETFKPKNKENQKLYLTYYGILPTGERFEIKDDSTFRDDNSIIFICYIKKRKPIFDDIKSEEFFKNEEEENLEDEIPEMTNIKIDEIIQPGLLRTISFEIKESQNNMIKDIKERLNENLKESMNDLILSASKEKINNNMSGFRKTFSNLTNRLFKRKKNCIDLMQKNNEKLKNINDTIKRYSSKDLPKVKPKSEPKSEHKPEPKPEPEEEKIIFKFNKILISLEKEINVKKDNIINIKNIQIQNISSKDYKSSLMSWLKEDNSDKNINFYPDKSNKELPLDDDEDFASKQNIDNLCINLIVDDPKEDLDYKMFISIINKENKKVISEKPLEVVVKMKKKKLTNEEINTILNKLKDENEYFDLVLDENEVKKIIIDKNGEEEEIKEIIKQKYEEEKQKKIEDLLNKLKQEINFDKYLNDDQVKEKILFYKFKENEIKDWIKSKKPKEPEPVPEPEPKPEPKPGPDPDEKIQAIIDQLEADYYISGFIDEDEIKEIIVKYNFDYEKIKVWVEGKM